MRLPLGDARETHLDANDISLAKQKFIDVLVQPHEDASNISREDAEQFVKQTLKTLNHPTTEDIQLCTRFIFYNITYSSARIRALNKYLLTLSKSFKPGIKRRISERTDDNTEGLGIINGKLEQPPSPSWKRYHVFLIIYNLLDMIYDIKGDDHLKEVDPTRRCHSYSAALYNLSHDVTAPEAEFDRDINMHVTEFAELAACRDPNAPSAQATEIGRTLPAVQLLLKNLKKRLERKPYDEDDGGVDNSWLREQNSHDAKRVLYLAHARNLNCWPIAKMADKAKNADTNGDFAAILARMLAEEKGSTTEEDITEDEDMMEDGGTAEDQANTEGNGTNKSEDSRKPKPSKNNLVRHGVPGDPDAPWHELPAANGLYMKRTRGYPLQARAFPKGGYELNLDDYDQDEILKEATWVKNEALRCFDPITKADEVQDINALGDIIWKDPNRPTRNYWGWTYDGIEKRKQLAKHFAENATGYDDLGPLPDPLPRLGEEGTWGPHVADDAIARARALAAERGGGAARGHGRAGRAQWRAGRRY